MDEMKACREKYWSELDAAGQIERMRYEVKRLQMAVDDLQDTAIRLREHQHNASGLILTPLVAWGTPFARLSRSGGATGDTAYF